jgi:hypothetical protein
MSNSFGIQSAMLDMKDAEEVMDVHFLANSAQ